MSDFIHDPRKPFFLAPFDKIITADSVYSIQPGKIAAGGSGVVYPASKEGSSIRFVLKESFPISHDPDLVWIRKSGVIVPSVPSEKPDDIADDIAAALLQSNRHDFEKESEISQLVSNASGHVIPVWDTPDVKEIVTHGVHYSIQNGDFQAGAPLYLVMQSQSEKGLFLEELLEECAKPISKNELYPLRTGGRPTPYTTALIIKGILLAVKAVHAAGFLHGDLHPANIFFLDVDSARGVLGHTCLLDFGAAYKLTDQKTDPIPAYTLKTTSGFTPFEMYAQNDGTLRLTPAADLYSVGRIMLWLLTGRLYAGKEKEMEFFTNPFLRKVKLAGCPPEAIKLINDILAKALRNDPADRYQSADDMIYGEQKGSPCIEKLIQLLRPSRNHLGLDIADPECRDFVGRKRELQEISNQLLHHHKPVVISGFDGMGKTALAVEFGRRYKEKHLGQVHFVLFAGSFRETLTGPIANAFSGYCKIDPLSKKPKSDEHVLQDVLKMLGEECSPCDILIIDRVQSPEKSFSELLAEPEYQQLQSLNFPLLLTTGAQAVKGSVSVGRLSTKELLSVMHQFCDLSNALLEPLIAAVDGHTGTVRKIAQVLRAFPSVTPKKLLARLDKELVSNIRAYPDGTVTTNGLRELFGITAEEVSHSYRIRQKGFIDFSVDFLQPLYGGQLRFADYLGQCFPDVAIFADDSVRAFDVRTKTFSISRNSMLLREPSAPEVSFDVIKDRLPSGKQGECLQPFYQFYGYMNDALLLTENGNIKGVNAYVGPASGNALASLRLRRELEQLYAKSEASRAPVPEMTAQNCPLRTTVHLKNGSGLAPLLKGHGRYSGLGLQLIVLFKVSKEDALFMNPEFQRYADGRCYWTLLSRRSDSAEEQPGFYQFAPCGNFIIFDHPEAARDWNTQQQNFNFFRSLMHHYIRELFNDTPATVESAFGTSSFDKPAYTGLFDPALRDPHTQELIGMLEDGRAELEFLGCSSSLSALKSDLVFLLTIDHENYFKENQYTFRSDFVSRSMKPYPLEYLYREEFLSSENCLAQELACPLALLKGSQLLKKRGFPNDPET